jgi:hypothetical protein
MAKLLLLLAIVCAFASCAFYTANGARATRQTGQEPCAPRLGRSAIGPVRWLLLRLYWRVSGSP